MDPVIDEQASRQDIDEVTQGPPPPRRSWREDEHLLLERDNQGATESEPTGTLRAEDAAALRPLWDEVATLVSGALVFRD